MSIENLLHAIPSFSALAPGELDALVAVVEERSYEAGTVIFAENAPCDAVYLLVRGEVEVTQDHDRMRAELNRLQPGALFGLIALVDHGTRSATCRAVTACDVVMWRTNVGTFLLNQSGSVARAFQLALGAQLASDFRQLDRRVRRELGKAG